jgi:CubicO group peptidase (beta-lactamase class C family)
MMRALVVMLVACSAAPKDVGPSKPPVAEQIARIEAGLLPAVQVRGEDVRLALEARMRELEIPALAIAVFADYELQWVKTYGLADVEKGIRATDETTFLAGSISKSVNALGQLQAVADGVLSLDAPINDALTSWKLPENELTRAKPVTLRMLLSHTAGTTVHGFRGYFEGEKVPTIVETLDGLPPANHPPIRVDLAPGTKFRYSGGGTTISMLALSERRKQPYAALMQARVLAPLGMTHSSYDQASAARTRFGATGYDRDGAAIKGGRIIAPEMAAAGLWTTPSDLARFFIEIAKARAGKSKLVTKEIALQMTTKVADIEGGPDGIGLGVFLNERNGTTWFGHGGSHIGFQCDAMTSLDGGNGIVIMASSENGFRIFAEIQRAIFAEYGWAGADAPIVRVALAPANRDRFAGKYVFDGHPVEIVQQGDALALRVPFAETSTTVAVAPDKLVVREDGGELRLRADGNLDVIARGRPQRIATKSDAHPLFLLEAGKLQEAAAALKRIENARDVENDINNRGYQLVKSRPKDALALFELNAAAFPESANAHDSLGEAYATTGDKANAIAEYKLAAAVLEADPRVSKENKPAFAARVREALAKLQP